MAFALNVEMSCFFVITFQLMSCGIRFWFTWMIVVVVFAVVASAATVAMVVVMKSGCYRLRFAKAESELSICHSNDFFFFNVYRVRNGSNRTSHIFTE